MFLGSLVVSADCRRVRMVWRKMNGANVVLIYPRPVISGLSQCRLPPFKNTVFVPIQSVPTKKSPEITALDMLKRY